MTEDPLRKAAALVVVPALLCLTVFYQAIQMDRANLNPWKGGGFRMFAEAPRFRSLKIIPVDRNDIGYVTPMPSPYRRSALKFAHRPAEGRLEEFGRELGGLEWHLVGLEKGPGQQYPVPAADAGGFPSSRPLPLKGIRLEMYEYTYEGGTGRLLGAPLVTIRSAQIPPR